MVASAAEPLLVVVLGPTASGKTALSIAIAEGLGGEIVNCDSVALYSDFEIGTAKPSPEQRSRVRHHLLDIADPTAAVTAGEYARRARGVLGEIKLRGSLPIVVGGTGLYLRALLDGLFPGPQRSEELRERLRNRATDRGPAHLHRILRRVDSASAHKIHPNDAPKLIRAIEVCLSARARMSDLWEQGREPLTGFRFVRIGLNPEREELYARINERVRRMFDLGLIAETRELVDKHGTAARPLGSLGYKQALQVVRGELTIEAAIAAVQQAHRNYAKRQMTWFRREPEVHWLTGFGDDAGVQSEALSRVKGLLT